MKNITTLTPNGSEEGINSKITQCDLGNMPVSSPKEPSSQSSLTTLVTWFCEMVKVFFDRINSSCVLIHKDKEILNENERCIISNKHEGISVNRCSYFKEDCVPGRKGTRWFSNI